MSYRPSYDLDLTSNPYTSSHNIKSTVGVIPYYPSYNLILSISEYIPDHDLIWGIGELPPPPLPTPTVIVSTFKSKWGKAFNFDNNFKKVWGEGTVVNCQFEIKYGKAEQLFNQFLLNQVRLVQPTDNTFKLGKSDKLKPLDNPYLQYLVKALKPQDINYKVVRHDTFNDWSTPTLTPYTVPPTKDINIKISYNSVRLYGVERIPIYDVIVEGYTPSHELSLKDVEYIPSYDLYTDVIQTKIIGYISDGHNPKSESKPYIPSYDLGLQNLRGISDEDKILVGYEKTPIQPTGNDWKFEGRKFANQINYSKSLPWGYGLNKFIVGGQWGEYYGADTTPPIDPNQPIDHPNYGVYVIVNTVNVNVLPGNEAIDFENFTLSLDVDSFAWTADFTISSRESLNLIKPVGRTVKEITVSINGTLFKLFVGQIKTRRSTDERGKLVEKFNCKAWSNLKRMAFPYAAKKSYTSTSLITAAQAVTAEAQPFSVSVNWDTVDWNIPANIHGYQDKTAMGAILDVVQSVGGVIIPDKNTDGFTVKPRFPVSPWDWDDVGTTVDRTMDEARFFSMDNETIPKDNPDGVYVYGEHSTSVAVKAVRVGRAGTALLPDVVNKYMTTVPAAQERGRIEVANNSFIELIPMSTYVDNLGLIELLDLIEFTELDGVTTWRGQVMSFSLQCERQGTALIQTITVARFFDDE